MTLAAITMTAPEAASPVQMYRATYSPDDNKLRLYAASRLDPETYKKVHDAGFRWAPKQALFVAPAWHRAGKTCSSHLPERLRMKTARLLNVRKHGRSGLSDTAESGPVNPHRHLMKWKDWPR